MEFKHRCAADVTVCLAHLVFWPVIKGRKGRKTERRGKKELRRGVHFRGDGI